MSLRFVLGAAITSALVAAVFALRPDSNAERQFDSGAAGLAANGASTSPGISATEGRVDPPVLEPEPFSATSPPPITREAVAGAIEGIVRFKGDGRPAAGATVIATAIGDDVAQPWDRAIPSMARLRPGSHPMREDRETVVISGADGRFRIDGAGSASWMLTCELEGYLSTATKSVIARAGSNWTFELEPAARVDLEFIDATNASEAILSASLRWKSPERVIYNSWSSDRPSVWLPPGDYQVVVTSVRLTNEIAFSTGVDLMEPVECSVGSDRRTLRLAVTPTRSLTVEVKRDPRFSPSSEFYVVCRPDLPTVAANSPANLLPEVGERIRLGRSQVIEGLRACRYEVTIRDKRYGGPLLSRFIDLREPGRTIAFDLAAADLGDPLDLTFTNAAGEAQMVTITSCELRDQPNSGLVVTTTRDAAQRITIYLERASRRSVLDAHPDAKLVLRVQHSRTGGHEFTIPLAVSTSRCVLPEPATLRVTLANLEARRAAPGIVASLARIEADGWESITKPRDMAWADEVTLGPVPPGDCVLLISADFSSQRALLVEPVTLIEGENAIRVRVPEVRRVEFEIAGLADSNLRIESQSSGVLFQRVRIDERSKGFALLADGAYRAIARDGARYGAADFQVPANRPVVVALSPVSCWRLMQLDLAGEFAALGLRVGDELVDCGGRSLGEIDDAGLQEIIALDREIPFGWMRDGNRFEVRANPRRFLTSAGVRHPYLEAVTPR